MLSVLNNPIYAGKIEFRGTTHPGLHGALVQPATFDAARRILSERDESQALRRAHPTEYLLSGVIRCGRCRRAYVGTSARGRKRLYQYYVCSTQYRYGSDFCAGDRLPKDALEKAVIEQMQDVYRDSAKRSLDRYFAAFEEGSLSPADCQERIAKLKAPIDALIAEEASLMLRAAEGATEVASATDVAEWAEDLGTLLRADTAQQRRRCSVFS